MIIIYFVFFIFLIKFAVNHTVNTFHTPWVFSLMNLANSGRMLPNLIEKLHKKEEHTSNNFILGTATKTIIISSDTLEMDNPSCEQSSKIDTNIHKCSALSVNL